MTPLPELANDGTIEAENISVQYAYAPRGQAATIRSRLHTVAYSRTVHDRGTKAADRWLSHIIIDRKDVDDHNAMHAVMMLLPGCRLANAPKPCCFVLGWETRICEHAAAGI
jgi:hypothetical protein